MKYLVIITSLFLFSSCHTVKQITFENIYEGHSTKGSHARGVAFNTDLIVVSGAKGNITKVNLKQKSFEHHKLNNIEDFRDVHINADGSLLMLNSGNKGQIWKLDTNGVSIIVMDADSVFLDGFSFYNNSQSGFAYGDPTNNKFNIYKTINSGKNWHQINSNLIPTSLKNEAGFAASGTGIQTPEKNVIYIATGISDTSRIIRSFNNGSNWDVVNTPIKSGDSFGIYGMYFNTAKEGFICGGSYVDTIYNDKIVFHTKNKGKTWTNISNGLPGYMSCISGNTNLSLLVTTGRLGTYYSINKGKTWLLKSKTPFYTCLVTESQIIYSGKNGIFKVENYTIKF